MKLSYRGVQYQYQPASVDMLTTEISAKFRGHRYNPSYPRHIPTPQPVAALKYRGVAYQTTETGEIQMVSAARPAVTPAKAVPLPLATQVRRLLPEEAARVHQETIRQRLQHRIEVARSRGDEQLLHQLEDELHRFA
jgi:hypothetical protein